ncbi:hypothetical protein SAMN05216271_1420 [Halopseudomonas sabulinigri]|uniref:Uncharacterized protein n=1 Tax=Halopseudomonas sabulinigri TaxID=472181 RepID=A0A1H1QEE1_9GAMM|nr:hypothetical protein [Halopseudomonas sabulinigri]SDS21693.1 hypothetical protein SAMN05216271_1420 [Halopseudomonas sabulinigri]
MISLAYGLLCASLLALGYWLWQRRSGLSENARGALTATLLALLLPAISSLLLALQSLELGDVVTHTQRIFGLAAQSISLPLLGLAALYLAFGLRWQPGNWGRILLGLMAAFELTRRMQLQHGYQWSISLVGLLLLILSCMLILRRDLRPMLTGAACCLGALAPLFSAGAPALAGLLDSSALVLWLFPALLGAGLTVGLLSEQAHNRSSDAPSAPATERT